MKTKLVKEDRGLPQPGLQSLTGARAAASSSSSSSSEPPRWPRSARPGPLGPINTSHSLGGDRARRVGPATAAREWAGASRLHVPLHMQRQVVRAREGAVAKVTLERPVARVLAVVAREFIRARELPAAAVPVAVVGLLTCREGQERASVSLPVTRLPTCGHCAHRHSPCSGHFWAHNLPKTRSLRRPPLLRFEHLRILGTCLPALDSRPQGSETRTVHSPVFRATPPERS